MTDLPCFLQGAACQIEAVSGGEGQQLKGGAPETVQKPRKTVIEKAASPA